MRTATPSPIICRFELLGWVKYHKYLDLNELRSDYEAGNQVALALAIHACGQRQMPLPRWVAEAWGKGCYNVCDRKVESWDEVLANGERKTVKQLVRERIRNQKKVMIIVRLEHYLEIQTTLRDGKRVRKGRRYEDPSPDRFDVIASDLTSDGGVHKVWGKCTRSEAKTLWYELAKERWFAIAQNAANQVSDKK